MFFRLPIEAVIDNWVGFWLDDVIETGFRTIDAGRPFAVSLANLTEAQQTRMNKRETLLVAINDLLEGYRGLDARDRVTVQSAFHDQRDIAAILAGHVVPAPLSSLPNAIQGPLDKLSKAAFATLQAVGIRAQSLDIHFLDGAGRTCAFCGYEPVDREPADPDWDHYLARSLYPFAAYNLRNLSPMGVGCNRVHKLAKDMLRDGRGQLRSCYDPYIQAPVEVHLRRSDPFGQGSRPVWVVALEGDSARNGTWNTVFRVEARWHDQLSAKHHSCLLDLARAFRRDQSPSDALIEQELRARASPPPDQRTHGDDIIRCAVFDHWLDYFNSGPDQCARLGALIRDVVRMRGRR